jgi:hypothetical protein
MILLPITNSIAEQLTLRNTLGRYCHNGQQQHRTLRHASPGPPTHERFLGGILASRIDERPDVKL